MIARDVRPSRTERCNEIETTAVRQDDVHECEIGPRARRNGEHFTDGSSVLDERALGSGASESESDALHVVDDQHDHLDVRLLRLAVGIDGSTWDSASLVGLAVTPEGDARASYRDGDERVECDRSCDVASTNARRRS